MDDEDLFFFFFNDTATTEIYTLSLHDALPIQAALLAAVVVAAALAAWSRAGAITTEELARRATARTGLAASLYSLDARGAAQARRRANRTLLGVRRVRLRRPRRRLLAVPWRDALALLRAPARLGWALVLGGAGVVAVA